MAGVVRVKLNPELLAWARTSSGYSIGDIAKLFGKSEDEIAAWESGNEMPTLPQLEKLANKLKRPLAAFFLPKPPVEPEIPRDYRVLSGKPIGQFEPDTLVAIREARTSLSEIVELSEAVGGDRLILSLPTIRLDDNPEEKAREFRSRLGITIDQQLRWENVNQALNAWRDVVFDFGVLALCLSFALHDARGFCIIENDLAAVGLSTKDVHEARIFSLFHEICHLCLNMPGVSGEVPAKDLHDEPNLRIERFCDKFAAAFLIPVYDETIDTELKQIAKEGISDDNDLRNFAKKLKVSKYALLRRMFEGGYIKEDSYWTAFNAWAELDRKSSKKKPSGGAHYAVVQFGEKGKRYVSLVMEALDSRAISYHDAASYLSVNTKWFDKARSYSQGEHR